MAQKTGVEMIKRGLAELRAGRGRRRFLTSAVSTAAVIFLAVEGATALLLAGMIADYGVDLAMGELRAVTAAGAVQAIWHLYSGQMTMMIVGSAVIGILTGLKAAGEAPGQIVITLNDLKQAQVVLACSDLSQLKRAYEGVDQATADALLANTNARIAFVDAASGR